MPDSLQEDYDRAEAAKTKIQSQIAQKRKDIVELNQQYDEMKKRFAELTSTAPAPTTAPATAPASAAGGTKPVAQAAPAPGGRPRKSNFSCRPVFASAAH